MIIVHSEVAKSLTRVDQLVLLVAAPRHDVDHDGEPLTASSLARRMSSFAVLRFIYMLLKCKWGCQEPQQVLLVAALCQHLPDRNTDTSGTMVQCCGAYVAGAL